MADIDSFSIGEVLELEEIFKLLDLSTDDKASITDGDSTYHLYNIANLRKDEEKILADIGFSKFNESIVFINKESIKANEILEYLIPVLIRKETELWEKIIDKVFEINEQRSNIFKPSSRQLRIVFKWKGNIPLNEPAFKDFVLELCMLIMESCKKNPHAYNLPDNCCSNEFWRRTKDLRDYYAHDPGQWSEDSFKKLKAAYDYFFKSNLKKSPITFVNVQFEILTKCLDFLDIVSKEINHK